VFFRLSKIEKPLSFLSLDSLNKHRKAHMGPNHSFLGFVKYTPGTHPRMSLQFKHMLSSSSLCKNKEVLARNGGGEIGKEMYLNLYSMEESLLNMTPFHSLCV
jgi:hypothetical protein